MNLRLPIGCQTTASYVRPETSVTKSSGQYKLIPNVDDEWLTLLLRIPEVPGSDLGP
jgi:hypothetical protein